MLEQLPWWVLPSIAALILVATHTYLGLHVISRNVFFVDLALAQVAALGSTVAYLYGFEIHDSVTYWISLLFAIGGAWFFAVARVRDDRVPQEAIIGLAFAVASAGAILLSAENPHGAEHLRDIMAGSILVVSGKEVLHAAAFYGVIGVFHWVFRKKFLLVSMDRKAAADRGLRVVLWDFLFYLSFAIIITSSVRIAGVLLVFILLIAPAVCGAMLATGIRPRLIIGWTCGVLATVAGLTLSARMDWPPAPAISCAFAVILLGAGVATAVVRAQRPALEAAKFALIVLALVGLGLGLTGLLSSPLASSWKSHEHEHGAPEHGHGSTREDLIATLKDEHENVRAKAAEQLGKLADPTVVPALVQALQDPSTAVKEKAAQALGALGRPEAADALAVAIGVRDEDEWVGLYEAEALVRCGGVRGMTELLRIATEADASIVRTSALRKALELAGRKVPKELDGADGQAALKELGGWWQNAESRARWDSAQQRVVAP